jgi:hypothetical protein
VSPTENLPTPGWNRADSLAAAVLATSPTVVLVAATAAGYPLITGDDVVQNYPLGELTGQVLRHGHLPLYDAFLWSGTPLLGGTNAHALLPITWLFAILPPLAAWVIGEILMLAAATIGTQLFLRRTGCSSLAAALGGACFGLGGFVSSQIVHIDFAAAATALPWMLVAFDGLATRAAGSRRRHCLLLAGCAAWICLCGSPDIIVDTAVIAGSYLLHLLLQPCERERRTIGRLRLVGWSLGGGVAGIAVGALQWWPAAAFVSSSERAHPSFGFISGGSLNWANFLELLVPHVLGGGSIGSRAFGGSFPLAEVDAYPGVLALVALFVMLVSWCHEGAWRWRVWLVVVAVALLLASGDHTPLEHLIAAVPVVGDQRLPSRALIGFALATTLLGGYFIDSLVRLHPSRCQVAAGLVPLAGIVGVVLVTIITGKPAGGALVAHAGTGWTLTGDLPLLVISVLLAGGAAALLLFGRSLAGRRRAVLVAVLVVVDLLLFDVNQSSLAPEYASALSPTEAASVTALTGAGGRYLVVDPRLSDGLALDHLGAPDLGVVDQLNDAGGYGSLTWGPYAAATGTHDQDAVMAAALADGTMASLGVRVVFTLPSQLVTTGTAPVRAVKVDAGARLVRWFGAALPVRSITIALANPSSGAGTPTVIGELASTCGLLGYGGRPVTTAPSVVVAKGTAKVTLRYSSPVTAAGLACGGSAVDSSLEIAEPLVQPAHRPAFTTSGPLAAAVGAGGWVEVEGVGGFSALVNHAAAAPYRLSTAGGSLQLLTNDPWTGSATVRVSSPAATSLVRSVADVPGWHASVLHSGRLTAVPVEQDGLVLRVDLAAGTSVVTFDYVAPGWRSGQLLALAGALACAGLVLAPLAAKRRRRLSAPGAPSPPPG